MSTETINTETAFVGDIHGNLDALRALWAALRSRGTPHTVFLGDYINKGEQSAGVLSQLIDYAKTGQATLLKGNHEQALLDALESRDLASFLKMGGAMTIRSYVGPVVGRDVLEALEASIPSEHLAALGQMQTTYETSDLIGQHHPSGTTPTDKFLISAHVPDGHYPRITSRSAAIDTGSGTLDGRLTAFLWPSLTYLQIGADGRLLAPR